MSAPPHHQFHGSNAFHHADQPQLVGLERRTSYNVYELENGQAVLLASLGSTATSSTVSNLSAGTTYSFEVAAVNSVGATATGWLQATTSSATASVTAPTGVNVTAPSSTVAHFPGVRRPARQAIRLRMEWRAGGEVASLGANTTSVDISGQSPNATQSFYVTAYNTTSSASSPLGECRDASRRGDRTAIEFDDRGHFEHDRYTFLGASAGATGYAIYYWNGFQAVLLGTVSSSATSVTIQGLAAGSTTYFAVVAYNNTSSAASNWVSLTTPVSTAVTAAEAVFGQSRTQSKPW